MILRKLSYCFTLMGLAAFQASFGFSQEFDSTVSPDYFLGSGNENSNFTVSRAGGIEIGLRAKLRFNEADGNRPANFFNSNGDGSYNFQARNVVGEAGLPAWWVFPESPEWSFEFSINSDTSGADARPVGDLTYELSLDQDPSLGADFFSFDPINLPYADHFFGTSTTLDGTDETVAGSAEQYAGYLQSKTVAQQAWNYAFFLDYLPRFSASAIGVYDIALTAFDSGEPIASVTIRVLVGAEQFAGQDSQTVVTNEVAQLTEHTYATNVSKGIDNSLDKKLENALDAYIGGIYGSRFEVAERLDSYISHVEAQRGKKLGNADADFLRAGAEYTQVLVVILP